MAENRHRGSTLDSFLEKEGILVTSKAQAIAEVTEWQRTQAARAARRFS